MSNQAQSTQTNHIHRMGGSQSEVTNIIIIGVLLSNQNLGAEHKSYVKVEVAVLGSPSLFVWMASAGVKQHWTWTTLG